MRVQRIVRREAGAGLGLDSALWVYSPVGCDRIKRFMLRVYPVVSQNSDDAHAALL